MASSYIGENVRRTEDDRLLAGFGRYTDDIRLPGMVHAAFVRSEHAHAKILAIDTGAAEDVEGVLAVYTGADVERMGLGAIPCVMRPQPKPGTELALPPRWPLARDRVRHVGEAVAMVVASDPQVAVDAAEAVEVDYETLPVVVDGLQATTGEAAQLHEEAPRNIAVQWEHGDSESVDAAFAKAAHVVELRVTNNRLVCNPMEPRGAIGDYDAGKERMTLYTGSQGVHNLRGMLADHVFKLPQSRIHVITDDVGGSFGMKMYLYPEQVMVLAAARDLRRPVKWISSRNEGFLTDSQGRDQISDASLAVDGEGNFLALRVHTTANLGAYLSSFGPFIPTAGGTRALSGAYRTPAIHVQVDAVFTNTAPVDAYRGAGRPESVYLLERLVDEAAHQLGIDPRDLRRRNFIPPEAMPFKTAMGLTYDSGDFARNLDDAVELADWDGFAGRRRDSEARGRLRGIGLSSYVEPCGGGRDQRADVRFQPDGTVTVLIGSQSTGMGHETAYAQIAAERLGIGMEKVRVVQGDSDVIAFGRGTSGSRSLPIGGTALVLALERVLERAREIAAYQLEAASADIEFEDGAFVVAGTDRAIRFEEIARSAFNPALVPPGTDLGLDQAADYMANDVTFPNGCHVCEVEIDPETGEVEIVNFVVVDDFGKVINPLLVDGQVHGGLAQGIGQALIEQTMYDPESGQMVSGSFMDYAMPRADDVPTFQVHRNEVPCTTNPLGVKGCGEAGAIGAPPAIINAVLDALRPLGVGDIEMPATPGRVWTAIDAARRSHGRLAG